MNSPISLIQNSSALFIDRDGVINQLRMADYVKERSEFILLPEVIPALEILRPMFKWIFIVTNQQGIGKGLMKENIDTIHEYMLEQLPESLRPNHIFHCPHLSSDHCACRKPKPGMALMAKNLYPEINLNLSLMVGDSESDMNFGKNAGMACFKIDLKNEQSNHQNFANLLAFAEHLVK